ncbi:MAG: hypothetical protein ACRCSG_04285 [Cellulosilyticaceae bacterium]
MSVTTKHKKARMLRDYFIEVGNMKLFKEEEQDKYIFFRSAFPFAENDAKQFMLILDDSVYLTMQALILQGIPSEKRSAVLELINTLHLQSPSIKYVLTDDGQLMTSAIFHAHEDNLDPKLVMSCVIEMFKTIGKQHYDQFKNILAV